jgi:hypothetical protein
LLYRVIRSKNTWKINTIVSFEGKIKISSFTKSGGWIGVSDAVSQSACSIRTSTPSGTPTLGCDYKENSLLEYNTDEFPAEFDKWFLFSINYSPETNEYKYYVDNKIIGKYSPNKSPESVGVYIGVWKPENNAMEVIMDDVKLFIKP